MDYVGMEEALEEALEREDTKVAEAAYALRQAYAERRKVEEEAIQTAVKAGDWAILSLNRPMLRRRTRTRARTRTRKERISEI